MYLRTCVQPSGNFCFGIHKPCFHVKNLRKTDFPALLGELDDGILVDNTRNFPDTDVEEAEADTIFEIPNAFPFRGTTYIAKSWADAKAADPKSITLPEQHSVSFSSLLKNWLGNNHSDDSMDQAFKNLPDSILFALASSSTDPKDLICMAEMCCKFIHDSKTGRPIGIKYKKDGRGGIRADIKNYPLFESLANNICLPEDYREVMVLRPGAQGGSEITGEWLDKDKNHVFEYLRRNSYIPWGHFAANMANDAVRYQIKDLSLGDMKGMRHLYYQRTYVRMAEQVGLQVPAQRRTLSSTDLEDLRKQIVDVFRDIKDKEEIQFNSTLWGWNFGFDFAHSGYRLHASHQQIHQQYALIPSTIPAVESMVQDKNNVMPTFGCGDLVAEFTAEYKQQTGHGFFDDYIQAINNNIRVDGDRKKEDSLVVYEDRHIMLFVPKAQTSQWELQLMVLGHTGNVLEADTKVRDSLDKGILTAMRTLTHMGAKMISVIEYPKRFDSADSDQRLLYAFLPKMPESPGAFSEAQLRWINGHYPEDFAIACRSALQKLEKRARKRNRCGD